VKILIIKFGALGDVVMATPLIEAIQIAHRSDEIALLTSPPFAPVFSSWQGLSVHAFERKGWRNILSVIRFIREGQFDRIYDLQGNDRTSVLCALSGAPERVGNHTRYPYTHHPVDKWRGEVHIFERMKHVLKSAGVEVQRNAPILPATVRSLEAVKHWISSHSNGENLVGLHASASALRTDKCWPNYEALAKKLCAHGFTPVWLGASGDKQKNQASARRSGGIDASGKFNIPELALFAKALKFAITNDSGPMHVLSAADIPIYGLFGPSDWRRNHALGQENNVIPSPADSGDIAAITTNLVWQRLVADQRVPKLDAGKAPSISLQQHP